MCFIQCSRSRALGSKFRTTFFLIWCTFSLSKINQKYCSQVGVTFRDEPGSPKFSVLSMYSTVTLHIHLSLYRRTWTTFSFLFTFSPDTLQRCGCETGKAASSEPASGSRKAASYVPASGSRNWPTCQSPACHHLRYTTGLLDSV